MKKWDWFFAGLAIVAVLLVASCRFSGLGIEYGNDTITVGNGTLELPETEDGGQ